MERPQLLIVDDDPSLLRMLAVGLEGLGFDIATARNGKEALAEVESQPPQVVVLDLEMPVMDGRAFYRELRARGCEARVLVLSAFDAKTAHDQLGADAYMRKPFDPEDLATAVATLAADR